MNKDNKKNRRKKRHENNIKNEIEYKENAWNSGKLIEEKYNGFSYSIDYTIKLSERLISYIRDEYYKSLQTDQPGLYFVKEFRKYREKIRDLIILWNPDVIEGDDYMLLKNLLELYWDRVVKYNDFNVLVNYLKCYDKF